MRGADDRSRQYSASSPQLANAIKTAREARTKGSKKKESAGSKKDITVRGY